MNETRRPQLAWRLKPWQTILLFNILLMIIYGLGTFFFDFFAGTATVGLGVQPTAGVSGIAMFFLFMIGYFTALVVILPVLLIKRFGIGASIYLLYFMPGSLVDYYYDWVKDPALIAPWAAFAWGFFGLVAGFSTDVTYRFLPASERIRAIAMGVVLACANFLLTLVVLMFFYKAPMATDSGSFWGVAYFGLPWLIITSAFGGYTAYAIARKA